MKLNSEQQKAVDRLYGPVMVLAGPGAGKTAVIVERVLAMLREGIRGESILVITFTRAAAAEMRGRFLARSANAGQPDEFPGLSALQSEAERVTFGTFHSVFFGILKRELGLSADNIADEETKRRIISDILEELRIPLENPRIYIDELLAGISSRKTHSLEEEEMSSRLGQSAAGGSASRIPETGGSRLQGQIAAGSAAVRSPEAGDARPGHSSPTGFAREQSNHSHAQVTNAAMRHTDGPSITESAELARIYKCYRREMRERRLVDYDDMILMTLKVLRERTESLEYWRSRFRFLLVDEFQDSSLAQYEILRLLAPPSANANIFVVGDDDQNIYGFRGARPEIMLSFPKDYPRAAMIKLGINYRSSAEIVAASQRLVRHNSLRFPKEITAAESGRATQVDGNRLNIGRAARTDGGDLYTGTACSAVTIRGFDRPRSQNEFILAEIRSLHSRKVPYNEIAVLYRTASGCRALTDLLSEAGIPFSADPTPPNIYSHWIAEDVAAYMRIFAGSRNRRDFLRIINKPSRWIKRSLFTTETVDLAMVARKAGRNSRVIDALRKLYFDIQKAAAMSPYAAISYLRRGMYYDEYLKEYADSRLTDYEELCLIMDELQEDAAQLRTFDDWLRHAVRASARGDSPAGSALSPDVGEGFPSGKGDGDKVSEAGSAADNMRTGSEVSGCGSEVGSVTEKMRANSKTSGAGSITDKMRIASKISGCGSGTASAVDITRTTLKDGDAVRISTMHRAKGLEFEAVFIPDANEGHTPYRLAKDPAAMEEERRLFYVAMTRAKRRLYVLCTKRRGNRGMEPSRFIRELGEAAQPGK